MVPILVMVLELVFLLGGSAVAKSIDNSGDKNKSTKSLSLFIYYVMVGLITLLIGIIGLDNYQSDIEEVLYTGSKYLGIVWLVCGGVDGVMAIVQKLGEISEATNKTHVRSANDLREQKNRESNDPSSNSKPKEVIPAWQWAQMQKKKEEAEKVEVENKIEDKAAEAVAEEKTSKNTFCVYCGDKLDDDQLFCGKCGKKRK